MISVCLATYNGEKYIEEQIRSILPQLSDCDEIVVSDDMSTDKTLEIIKSIKDDRIKIIVNKAKQEYKDNSLPDVFQLVQRIKRNFENALKYAKGDIVFLSDQDDRWHENKVKEVLNVMTDNTVCVIHDARVVNSAGEVLYDSFLKFYKPCNGRVACFWRSPFMGCCMAFKRAVLVAAMPFPQDAVEYDTWIGMKAYNVGKIKMLDKVLIDYRRHGDNASILTSKKVNSLKIKIQRRYYLLKNLLK